MALSLKTMFRHLSQLNSGYAVYRQLQEDAALAKRAQQALQFLFDTLPAPKTVVVVSKSGELVLWADSAASAFLLNQCQKRLHDTLVKAGMGNIAGLRIRVEPSLQNEGCKRG
jgi:hypothetical protein